MFEIGPAVQLTAQHVRQGSPAPAQANLPLGQGDAGGGGGAAALHGIEQQLQLSVLQPLQEAVGGRFELGVGLGVAVQSLTIWALFAGGATPTTAPPESPDKHRALGLEHAT